MDFITQEDGSIKITPVTQEDHELFQQIEDQRPLWCKCDDPHSGEVDFVDDNTPDALVMKHHYIHRACGKITQIG